MNFVLKGALFLSLVVSSWNAMAAAPTFSNISQSDLETIVKDFGAAFVHTSVSPASTLGDIFGFEVGVIGGAATVPGVEALVKANDPTAKVAVLPQAGLFGAVSVPMGFKFELLMLPKKDLQSVNYAYHSFAVQWTFSKVLPLPVDMALKLHNSNTDLNYYQDISGVNSKIEVAEKVTGLSLLVSQKLTIFEPYAGVGIVKSKGDVNIIGTNTFFTFPAQNGSAEYNGRQIFLGMNLNLFMLKIGAEVGKVNDSKKASLKVSFAF